MLFCTFLCRHCTTATWKCLISRFTEEVLKRQRNFLSASELGYDSLTKLVTWSNRDEDWKNANSLFQRHFVCRFCPRTLRSLELRLSIALLLARHLAATSLLRQPVRSQRLHVDFRFLDELGMQGMSECLQMVVQEFHPVHGVLPASCCLPIGGLSTKPYIDICVKFLFV